jgi:hypothetical protein
LREYSNYDVAQPIREIVDLMLPLYLPQEILSEARHQLQDGKTVLIRTSLTKKTGAEILAAGLSNEPSNFKSAVPEPTGEQLVSYEEDPIGDPNRSEESTLRAIFLAAFHATEINQSPESIRKQLSAHFRVLKGVKKRQSYCAVKLAAHGVNQENQATRLSKLDIPDLLFIGLLPDSQTVGFERLVMTCLSLLFESDEKGKPR